VQNGGFELGAFTDWVVNSPGGFTTVASDEPHCGAYEAWLGPWPTLGSITQTLTTVPGQTYVLTYWLTCPGSPDEFETMWNGQVLNDLVNLPAQPYTEYSFTVTATSSSTDLEFIFGDSPNHFGLDDISVVAAQ